MTRFISIIVPGFFLVVLVGVLTGLFYFSRPEMTAREAFVPCPITIATNLTTHDAKWPDYWLLYSRDGLDSTPGIVVTPSGDACELHVRSSGGGLKGGADWRLGYVLPDTKLVRGKKIEVTMELMADRDVVLDSAQIYVSFGTGGFGLGGGTPSSPLMLGPTPRVFQGAADVPPDASTFEFWFRAAFDKGSVKPIGARILLKAAISKK